MKKIILLIPLLILTGCTNKEKLFKQYAKEYYENHMMMINDIDSVTISLDDLKNAETEDNYNLSKLKRCKNTSKIIFYLDKETKSIKNEKIELNCWF